MATILDKIIAEKQIEVEKLKKLGPFPCITSHKKRSFISNLSSAVEVAIIAEFKRASPSKGDINIGLDPKTQAKHYEDGGANAVSVLTDSSFFKGSYEDLQAVRESIDLPILCKDFIIDQIQIDLAKKSGADLILLIAAALNEEKLKYLYEYALSLDLEVLMEVHNKEEVSKVLKTGNRLIGVNNRNLKTFEVSLETTEELAPMIKTEGCYLISESGIKNVNDVNRVIRAGANGILVGETFMKHSDLSSALKEMKRPLQEVLINEG